jgi:hypothetical protein
MATGVQDTMIILNRIHKDGTLTGEAININNIIGANENGDVIWVRYWDGQEVRRMMVEESLSMITCKMNFARYGNG